jgi:hypothetical protein
MSINSNQIIKKPDIVIDPNFFLPPGVVDARYPNGDETDQAETTDTEITETVDGSVDSPFDESLETGEDNNVSTLFPPDSVIVVSQVIRTGDNGQQVVDVIIEVEDVPTSIQVDVRMAKA